VETKLAIKHSIKGTGTYGKKEKKGTRGKKKKKARKLRVQPPNKSQKGETQGETSSAKTRKPLNKQTQSWWQKESNRKMTGQNTPPKVKR